MSAEQIKSDTLTILLCNQVHKFLTDKQRAIKISKTCKIIRDRTKDDILYNACRNVIKATTGGAYETVVSTINQTQNNYYNEYQK
jgi:ribosomal protein L31